ncbi:MAG: hypothetical protein ABIG61_01685 [Planctomycetota bacterium]
MAKMSNNNYGHRFQRMQQQPQQQAPPPQERDRHFFRVSWLLVPICVLAMWYLLNHVHPVIEWESVMDFLNIHNRERYTRLAVLCLTLIFIVAAVRILGRKDD